MRAQLYTNIIRTHLTKDAEKTILRLADSSPVRLRKLATDRDGSNSV